MNKILHHIHNLYICWYNTVCVLCHHSVCVLSTQSTKYAEINNKIVRLFYKVYVFSSNYSYAVFIQSKWSIANKYTYYRYEQYNTRFFPSLQIYKCTTIYVWFILNFTDIQILRSYIKFLSVPILDTICTLD